MKALVFDKAGLDNLRTDDIEKPQAGSHDVVIKVAMAGVNPIDYFTVGLQRPVKPIPHTPGAEFAGTVVEVGEHATYVKKRDKVTVYGRVFDGVCDMCLSNREMLCRNGGIIGVVTNGGFQEYISVPEKNVFKIPEDLSWETAASLTVSALTPYHALKEASLQPHETLIVFGASGNTGMFAVQFGKRFGANVIALSKKNWVKDFGADHVVGYDSAGEAVKAITSGRMADVALNSLGSKAWSASFDLLGLSGRLVLFGTLTGAKSDIDLAKIYNNQIKIIGSTGGTRKELSEIIDASKTLRVKVWRKFKLEEGREALRCLFANKRDGRILLEM